MSLKKLLLILLDGNVAKTLNLTQVKEHGSGVYGVYYKLNVKQGVKVIGDRGHKTIKKLKASLVWRHATKETSLLRRCRKLYNLIPKSYGTVPVKIKNCYYPGIVMQHLDGDVLSDITSPSKGDIICTEIIHKLEDVGIFHDDLHSSNVISLNNKYYVIDFSPYHVEISNE